MVSHDVRIRIQHDIYALCSLGISRRFATELSYDLTHRFVGTPSLRAFRQCFRDKLNTSSAILHLCISDILHTASYSAFVYSLLSSITSTHTHLPKTVHEIITTMGLAPVLKVSLFSSFGREFVV